MIYLLLRRGVDAVLPAFETDSVEVTRNKELEVSYILSDGDSSFKEHKLPDCVDCAGLPEVRRH